MEDPFEKIRVPNNPDGSLPNFDDGFVNLDYGFPEEFRSGNANNEQNNYFDLEFLISFNRIMKDFLVEGKSWFFKYKEYIITNSPENIYKSKFGNIIVKRVVGNTKIGLITTKKFQNRVFINTKNKTVNFLMLFLYQGLHSVHEKDEEKYAFKIYFSDYKNYKATILEIGHTESEYHKKRILDQFNKQFTLTKNNFNTIIWLYQVAPPFVIEKRDLEVVKADLIKILNGWVTQGTIPIFGSDINVEEAVLNILLGIFRKMNHAKTFLDFLLESFDDTQTILERLFYKVDNKFGKENFTKLVQFLYGIWQTSSYSTFKEKELKKESGPVFLPYESQKIIGFFKSNTNVTFNKQNIDIKLTKILGYETEYLGNSSRQKPITKTLNYTYNPYQLIYLSETVKDTAIKTPKLIPAFFLKAIENVAFWSNAITSVEYGADILSTFSGIGNIAKFRYLKRVVQVAEEYRNAQKVKQTLTVASNIKLLTGVVEIASSSVNLMIRISGTDSKFAKALQEYLFYLELVTLAGELDLAIKNKLRKSSKKALIASQEHISKAFINVNNFKEGLDFYELIKTLAKYSDEIIEFVPTNGLNKYGETLASSLAVSFRKTLGKGAKHNGNIAIFEYVDELGNTKIKEFTTFEKKAEWIKNGFDIKPHAEDIGIKWLKDNKIDFKKVKSIYSELQPCELAGYNCKVKLKKLFAKTKIEHNYIYTNQKIRVEAINLRKNDLDRLIKN